MYPQGRSRQNEAAVQQFREKGMRCHDKVAKMGPRQDQAVPDVIGDQKEGPPSGRPVSKPARRSR